MSTFFKTTFWNHTIIMIVCILLIMIVQNSLWPLSVSKGIPIYLWIPCLVYWFLYRTTGESLLMIYFISLITAGSTTVLVSYLLLIHALIFLVILLFKRVYYTSLVFFSVATGLSLLCFPVLLWMISMGSEKYVSQVFFWLNGSVVSWLLSFPLLWLFTKTDRIMLMSSTHRRTKII